MSVGKKIKDLRVQNNMTQEDLSEKLHVTRNAVSKWENDKGLPNMDSLVLLSKLFNVSLDYLFGANEIIKTTIENKNKNEINKNLLSSIILFFVFTFLGTLIPYYFYRIDLGSEKIAMIIILPMVSLLLGLISVLVLNNLLYISISTALALVPIYVFFDLYMINVSLGIWGLLYYIIFILAYIVLSKVLSMKVSKKNVIRSKNIFLLVSIVILLTFIIHTIYKIIGLLKCFWCSAPWYTVLVINIIIYIIPFTLNFVLYLYYAKECKERVVI